MIEISTSNLKTRKKVLIDDHEFTVRRYGAGEQLTLNQLMRQAKKLEDKLGSGEATEADEVAAEKLSQQLLDIFAGLFDDGGDGTRSLQLVSSLNQDEIQEMFNQIFKDDELGTPEAS